jgi:hypothetical protein
MIAVSSARTVEVLLSRPHGKTVVGRHRNSDVFAAKGGEWNDDKRIM